MLLPGDEGSSPCSSTGAAFAINSERCFPADFSTLRSAAISSAGCLVPAPVCPDVAAGVDRLGLVAPLEANTVFIVDDPVGHEDVVLPTVETSPRYVAVGIRLGLTAEKVHSAIVQHVRFVRP